MAELPFTKKQLAAAKFRLLLAVALDKTLSKLAVRAATVMACKRINFNTGAVAHCSMATYCLDLGIKSDSSMRDALAELEGVYFAAEKKFGKSNRYTIADRFFVEDDHEEGDHDGDDEPRRKLRRYPAAKCGD